MGMHKRMVFSMVCGVAVAFGAPARAAYVQVGLPALEQLPQEHEYQKTLRAFMATLTEKDFEVQQHEITIAPAADPEDQYRMWLLKISLPQVGVATLPPAAFTLKSIEAQKGMVAPAGPHESMALSWLASWDYAGNPYRG